MKDAKGHGSDAHQTGVNQIGQVRHMHNIWLYTAPDGTKTIEAKKYDYNPFWLENEKQRIIWQGLAESPEAAIAKAQTTRGSWSRELKRVLKAKAA